MIPNRNPEITYNRTNLVLRLMYENGFITKEEYESARFSSDKDPFEDGFTVIEKSSRESLYPMPYFVEYVILDVRDRLMEQNGWTGDEGRQKAMKLIQEGGLHIYTTVDPEIQKSLEETVYNYKNLPKLANSNDRVLRDNQGNEIEQPQAAAVVMDHNTGEIIAMVGGRKFSERAVLDQPSQPELVPRFMYKTLAVYGPFIEAGYPGGIYWKTYPSPLKDGKGRSKGYPNNYDYKFSGLVDMRTAIRRSINVPAARIVAERVSTDYAAEKLLEMGISTNAYIKDKFPASLALGSDAINMVETAAAYATIANKGVYTRGLYPLRKYWTKTATRF
jgi:penicillin-binding protein 1A